MSLLGSAGAPAGAWPEPSPRQAAWGLAGITLLALALRLHRLSSGLWLDEIAPVLLYGNLSPLEVLATYPRPNNHLLNTLLVNASMALFGPSDWAIRLPAALFGTATVPVVFRLAHRALGRGTSLAVALLVAVSYHHVFFSQNARGYAPYLLFSLAGTDCLLRLLETGRSRWGGLYAVAMVLALAAVPLAGVVLVAHALVAAGWLGTALRRGERPGGEAARAVAALGAAATGGALLYAPLLGRVAASVRASYLEDRIGFSFTSRELLGDLLHGVSAGLGAGVLLVGAAVAAIAAAGLVRLARRDPGTASGLGLPPVLTIVALGVGGATFYPRFFLLALPLGLLALVHGLVLVAGAVTARRQRRSAPVFAVLVTLTAAVSIMSLVPYYRVPKQSYRAALELLEQEASSGIRVVVLDTATGPVRYYAPGYDLEEGRDLFYARTERDLAALLCTQPADRVRLVTTFPASLRARFPSWSRGLAQEWEVMRAFPASVRGGEIRVWKHRKAGVDSLCRPAKTESDRS